MAHWHHLQLFLVCFVMGSCLARVPGSLGLPPIKPMSPSVNTRTLGLKPHLKKPLFVRGGSNPPATLFTTIVPIVGIFVTSTMTVAGLPAILNARSEKTLGSLNALPFVMVLGNSLAWVSYALVKRNPYIFLSNAPGVLSGLYMFSSGVLFGSDSQSRLLERTALGMAFILLVANGWGAIVLDPTEHAKLAAVMATVFTLAFYSAPLSALGYILRSRDASALCPPMVIMAMLNGLLWVSYGVAVKDYGVAIPNGTGALLSFIQLILIIAF